MDSTGYACTRDASAEPAWATGHDTHAAPTVRYRYAELAAAVRKAVLRSWHEA